MEKIVLASQSPRRKQLLEWAEIDFEIIISSTEETYPATISMTEVPIYIARNKALAVKDTLGENRTILAADTIVVLNDRVMGKPADRHEAIDMLTQLSGNKHQVITGVVIMQGNRETAFSDTTEVLFHPLSKEQIVFYVDNYKPYDKAGAYGIQEWIGVIGIRSVKGDFYNVMGLPVSRVVQALNSF